MRKILLGVAFLLLFFHSCRNKSQELIEILLSNPSTPEFCNNNQLMFAYTKYLTYSNTIDYSSGIDYYYVYNTVTKGVNFKTNIFFSNKQASQLGCGGKYFVYCKCIEGSCPNIISETGFSGDYYVYDNFNCIAENIETGEVKLLLDTVRADIVNKKKELSFVGPYSFNLFYTPVVSNNKVLLSYLVGNICPPEFNVEILGDSVGCNPYDDYNMYVLLVDIENPSDYKFFNILFSRYASPEMNEKYLIAGGYVYNFITQEIKKINTDFRLYKKGLNLLSAPISTPIPYRGSSHILSGDNFVFSVGGDIYVHNLETDEEKLIYQQPDKDSFAQGEAIWGDKIVWMNVKKTGETTKYGNFLAETSIMLYNLTTGELREIVPEKPNPLAPTTNGRYIAWLDTEVGDKEKGRSPDVYLYDIETRETWKVTEGLE